MRAVSTRDGRERDVNRCPSCSVVRVAQCRPAMAVLGIRLRGCRPSSRMRCGRRTTAGSRPMPLAASRLRTRMGPVSAPPAEVSRLPPGPWTVAARSGVSPADSVKGCRRLFSMHGCATLTGASSFSRMLLSGGGIAESPIPLAFLERREVAAVAARSSSVAAGGGRGCLGGASGSLCGSSGVLSSRQSAEWAWSTVHADPCNQHAERPARPPEARPGRPGRCRPAGDDLRVSKCDNGLG